ncbi:hypothetical protein Patl1_25624 [Pistacia atlantica]|uniref:Uncharacterized protein n=1 Tax=Pistacia atlantica TaxID=434234 RepID=A0ACC1B1B0_9ROSI|nr:hypothetical protein Patl1_25624 [Pistacia atlantica]
MGTFLNKIKWQTSTFLHEKYKIARLALADVSEAELLAEEATNSDPWGPEARIMTKIADASFDVDDYWRVVDVLHRRFYNFDWKQWRESYKSLVLLEFLITHGPEDLAEEFQCETDVIQELATFKYIDERGLNWGAIMQKRAESILNLLRGGKILKEARLKAIKITNEIQGFGSDSMTASPSSSTSSAASRTSSFGSYATSNSALSDICDFNKLDLIPCPGKEVTTNYSQGGIQDEKPSSFKANNNGFEGLHLWDSPRGEETGSLLDSEDVDIEDGEGKDGFVSGICSKLGISPCKKFDGGKVAFRTFSDMNNRSAKKRFDRQYSLGY